MAEVKDTGIIPEPMFAGLSKNRTVADFARSPDFDHDGALNMAFAAGSGDQKHDEQLQAAIASDDPVKRYWGLSGLMLRGKADGVRPLLEDKHSVIRTLAAETLHAAGNIETAKKALLAELDRDIDDYSCLYLTNALTRFGFTDEIPDSWIRSSLADQHSGEYVKRFATQLRNKRR